MTDATVLEVRGVSRTFAPGTPALAGVSLTAEPGECVVVVGPSGCGKTTLLRVIAGLETPDAGTVLLRGRDLAGVPPAHRSTTMLFQADTLFGDLTVAQNVGFGLAARGRRGRDAAEAIEVALLRVGLTGLDDRYPDQLSGGQQRRVALARALVLSPDVLLLDEPVVGLEESLRRQILVQVRRLQRTLGLAVVYVTHDQSEALSMADRLVVMNRGTVVQDASPREVFDRPQSLFVAGFLGRSTFVDAQVDAAGDGWADVRALGGRWRLPAHPDVRPGAASLVVRPHALRVAPRTPSPGAWTQVAGDAGLVQDAFYLGDRVEYLIESEHGSLVATADVREAPLASGQPVTLVPDPSLLWVLPAP